MLKCLEDAINNPVRRGIREIPLNDNPPSIGATKQAFKELFAKFSNGRILIHADEHRQMCDCMRDPEAGAEFSRGSMSVLAQIPGVTVLATYTDVPPLPPQHSSQVCRDPVPVPALDVNAAMQAFPELANIQKRLATRKDKLDGDQERLLRTTPLSMVQVRGTIFKSFLEKFKIESEKADLTKALTECCRLCMVDLRLPVSNDDAAKLLVGVPDINDAEFHRKARNLVVYNGLVTCDFKALLEQFDRDPKGVTVYNDGCNLMRDCVESNVDLTAHRPLEAAYYWTFHKSFTGRTFDSGRRLMLSSASSWSLTASFQKRIPRRPPKIGLARLYPKSSIH